MKIYRIIENKRVWFGISIAIIISGIIALGINGINWSIDFTGGNILNYDVKEAYSLDEVRGVLGELAISSEAKKAGDLGRQLIIKTGPEVTAMQEKDITSLLAEKWPEIELVESESITPVIGKELQGQAILALIIANLGMLAYITFRFEFKSALAAVLALIHDVAIVLSFYILFHIPIDGTIIAVILTIVGYSINDTIVIFDRIRENLKSAHREPFDKVANLSVSQTLTRTMNTSLTTLLTVFMLFVFGGETLKDFTLALIIGIISGTYSSIFIASPLWSIFRTKTKAF